MLKWTQSGREFSENDLNQIRETIDWLPDLTRRDLIGTICEHLDWHSASGRPKVQACEALLEKLSTAGLIGTLPEKPQTKTISCTHKAIGLTERTLNQKHLKCHLHTIEPVQLDVVTQRPEVALWKEYMERFHPLGYKGGFGYRLRYFIRSGSLILGCVFLAGAAKAIAVRDQWLGWEPNIRLNNLSWIINNTRFLIFPHIEIPHLASHVLGKLTRRVVMDWQQHWGFSPLLMETFVDPIFYNGTCYQAAGWELLGKTSGRGLARPGKEYRSSPRLIFVKPLHPNFKNQLITTKLKGRKNDE